MLESLLNMLDGKPARRVVWTADLHYWFAAHRPDLARDERAHLAFCRELGVMPYYWYERFWLGEPRYDGVEFSQIRDGERTVRLWKTPAGELREHRQFMAESCSEAITRHPVQDQRDLETLLYVLQHRHLEPANLDDYHQRRQLWSQCDGLPSVGLPRSPLPAFLYEWAGLEHGIYLLMDHEELVGRIFDLLDAQEQPILDAVCQAKPPLVHFPDNLSGDNLAGLFDLHMADRYRRRLDRLHEAGIRVAVHLDGVVRPLLPKLAALGFDAVEALTPAPVGDVTLEDLRPLAGSDRVVLWGGLPGAMFAPPFAWSDLRAHLDKLLACWRGTPFVIGVADQVPPDGDIEFVKRISELLKTLT
ncbi:MAG: hypothetical protein GXY33_02350 [Phycisphaerae bacterium]|nr:hypothetical protein [Phycisphaerae bacterium]